MPTVSVTRALAGDAVVAQALWDDVARWPEWVDGLARIEAVDPSWPLVGATVVWSSGPAGRGRVLERMLDHRPGAETVATEDDALTGEQTITFTAAPAAPAAGAEAAAGDVEVTLALRWRRRRGNPVAAVVDLLFVRSAMTDALARTLDAFGMALVTPG